ncbi:anti-sigma factor [Sphingobacterium hungaricum]|uniref:Anti-sigma K factor RskA C-terminal domain-containing protein n=1 Tax=Sphingobacterium hungaricum TaxID=2082723 RepID=A0A928YQD7_9SPHI|nr:anti-sigma factor [Sphingobacterium hungaricum]MBE8712935.1 hypothetical protein [Sphingobacterium hungaricum]
MNIKEYISSGVIEAYVLGLATEEEASILQCIRKNNSEVEQAILDAQLILEDFSTAQAVAPPVELKDAIWSQLNQQPVDTTTDSSFGFDENEKEAKVVPMTKKTTDWKKLAIAASVLFVASFGTTIYFQNKSKENQTELNALVAENKATAQSLDQLKEKWSLLQNPDLKTITLAGVEQHPDLKAHVFWNTKTSEVYLSSENLPKVPDGMQYQLWAIVDGTPVDAGVFDLTDSEGISKMLKIEKAQAFAITLEKAGGNPTPTLTQLYVMGNI